jgi:putative nucleotidyltransferase with HDIG domain
VSHSDEPPSIPAAVKPRRNGRKLSLTLRIRTSLRSARDRVMGAHFAWSAAFVGVLVLLLGTERCAPDYESLAVGRIAPRDVKALFDTDLVDETLTDERRRQARDRVLDVYVHDRDRGIRLANRLASVFEQGRRTMEEASLAERDPVAAARSALGERFPAAAIATLAGSRFDAAIERELTAALRGVLASRVVGNKALLEQEPSITLLDVPGDASTTVSRYEEFLDLEAARDRVRREVNERLQLEPAAERALGELTASFVDANVYFEPEATYERRLEAERAVAPILVRVAQGDFLVREGERITPETMARIEAASRAGEPLDGRQLVAILVVASLLGFFLYRYASYHQRGFRKLRHLHALLVLVTLSMLVLSRAILWLAGLVVDDLGEPFHRLGSYTYLMPLGAGAILVALLANGRIATVYAAFASLLYGAVHGWNPYLMLWATFVQLAGVYAISTYRERSALLRAGLVVGGVGAISTLALEALAGVPGGPDWALYPAALAFVGGAVGVGLIVNFSLPIFERLFDVLTDIRLLELSNVNNPLLSELALKAPGSYNHSLVVGHLAEEAAKAIGANSLFCRVAAFYHDVGKMSKPEYFVENQRGRNPHDRLAPSMSALIIASHVKDGVRLAREAGVPEQIVDVIPQHHGTKLMTYFYEKAKSCADPDLGQVKEEDFRYPGPKPQTREAAIFMLADGVEAAARTLEEPTANRLKEVIRKVTTGIVLDGQLLACELTFADLDKIQAAFLRNLVSMYHHRVDYPGFEFGRKGPRGGEGRPAGELGPRAVARSS